MSPITTYETTQAPKTKSEIPPVAAPGLLELRLGSPANMMTATMNKTTLATAMPFVMSRAVTRGRRRDGGSAIAGGDAAVATAGEDEVDVTAGGYVVGAGSRAYAADGASAVGAAGSAANGG
jgi:hypothetical protein